MRHTKPSRKGSDTRAWAQALAKGFAMISPKTLGQVRLKTAVALDKTRIAVVYDDWEGKPTGRLYTLAELDEFDFSQQDPVITAAGIVTGELIEPSTGRHLDNAALLQPLNDQFPGLHWIGTTPA